MGSDVDDKGSGVDDVGSNFDDLGSGGDDVGSDVDDVGSGGDGMIFNVKEKRVRLSTLHKAAIKHNRFIFGYIWL